MKRPHGSRETERLVSGRPRRPSSSFKSPVPTSTLGSRTRSACSLTTACLWSEPPTTSPPPGSPPSSGLSSPRPLAASWANRSTWSFACSTAGRTAAPSPSRCSHLKLRRGQHPARPGPSHHRTPYATSEQCTNEFVESIRQGRTEEFRAKYRYLDILLIDDVQFLAGKERTQEEFFYTLNDLHSASSQIVISSDRSPRLISLLEDRLRSRFEWGLIADIQPPVLETRLAILRAKSIHPRLDLPRDVLHFLAERSKHNVRELEGSFNRMVAHARLLRADITLDIAIEALAPVAPRARTYPHPDAVIKAVGDYFTLSPADLCGQH